MKKQSYKRLITSLFFKITYSRIKSEITSLNIRLDEMSTFRDSMTRSSVCHLSSVVNRSSENVDLKESTICAAFTIMLL
ncbi:hypothetical protein T01_13670 [Trichinella spiralis]|uniref:Uncharacterized protein n=1 Tax=Trichinella spiralis TaxID=6334 RepID=A0A0V1B173_TRISP|nr:hypothetical protein T01_13670 [Trichinella spiralis]